MRLASCALIGEPSSVIDESNVAFMLVFIGRKTSDKPDSLRSSILGSVIPPGGPKVDDLMLESMWGEERECLSARRCSIGGIAGDGGTSRATGLVIRSDEFVFKLSWLGLRFIAGILGLMKTGDAGSDAIVFVMVEAITGGWMERPFMFRGRLSPGEVIGRSSELPNSAAVVMGEGLFNGPPNDVEG